MPPRTTEPRNPEDLPLEREPEHPPVEVDPDPSKADDAGRAVGQFLGGVIDGVRRQVSLPTIIALATAAGAGGGFAGRMVFDPSGEQVAIGDAATPEQVQMLTKAVADLNIRLARAEAKQDTHDHLDAHPPALRELERLTVTVGTLANTVAAIDRRVDELEQ